MTAVAVRDSLLRALRLDLVGPDDTQPRDAGLAAEVLDVPPTHWYLTGFLVPSGVRPELFEDATADEAVGGAVPAGDDDDDTAEPARRPVFPSSMGVTVLVRAESTAVEVTARWATYTPAPRAPDAAAAEASERGALAPQRWQRSAHGATESLSLDPAALRKGVVLAGSGGVALRGAIRPVRNEERACCPAGTRVLTVFLVNQRATPEAKTEHDRGVIFQARLDLRCNEDFVPRPNVRGRSPTDDPDERLGDLHYRDAFEYAVGHGVSAEAEVKGTGDDVFCDHVFTTWTPCARVERVVPSEVPGCELGMDALAAAESAAALQTSLRPLVAAYRAWITAQRVVSLGTDGHRALREQLLDDAGRCCDRIAAGVAAMADPQVFEAFRRANRAMAAAARQRSPERYAKGEGPTWRPFQLAFVLMNVPAQANPALPDRDTVDLIFFPTGGGKTEAYLGLAAFTLLLRRLRHPGLTSAGVAVLMRYTLRLLTLDQLDRAATLVCALELQRRDDEARLGPHRFSIGLWVGSAATPNRFGSFSEEATAVARTLAFSKSPRSAPSPIPLDRCPWCKEAFGQDTFRIAPSLEAPRHLRVRCLGLKCPFRSSSRWPEGLPIVAVDDEIYRELPCFLIATVDKFAALPWVGRSGALLGRNVTHHGPDVFVSAADDPHGALPLPTPLRAPDLIIQDELHLISGPLGTVVGLYETALDALSARTCDGVTVRPKIVASTATVRNAHAQVRALFARSDVRVFPPPGPDRRSSFFAETLSMADPRGGQRMYLGLAAPGRSMKVLLLRAYTTLLATAKRAFERDPSAAEPYMTLVGYFNSLRELGGARRIVEDEVRSKAGRFDRRRRAEGETGDPPAVARAIAYECVELTSRESIDNVKTAKARLAVKFTDAPDKKRPPVDVALASNMISVGLDIDRLGLMVVCGQPKTAAEYIQASSRVGRVAADPGLVVTLLNVHRPRDRSHFERFHAFHQSFYRAVEATSVTPFSPRAIDRVLPAVTVALARLGEAELTPADGAAALIPVRERVAQWVADTLARRAEEHRSAAPPDQTVAELTQGLRDEVAALFDAWSHVITDDPSAKGVVYQTYEEGGAGGRALLYTPLDERLREANKYERRFVAGRSMRDVEVATDVMVRTRKAVAASLADEEESAS